MSALSTPSAAATASSKRFLRIIYADDVAELRDVARLSLSREGHGIECVADGALALHRVTEDRGFDLVMTDHHMPNMNGLQLVAALRELRFAGRIIVFTSDVTEAVAAEYKRLNVDRLLYKPIFPSALRQIIAEMFPSTRATGSTGTDRPLAGQADVRG